MSFTNAVINTRKVNIIRDPTDPELMNDVVHYLKEGDKLKVDTSKEFYSWNDKAYYMTDILSNGENCFVIKDAVNV